MKESLKSYQVRGLCITPTSKVRAPTMVLLPIVEEEKMDRKTDSKGV
jgi:hypothetical protein